ncbi:threonine/serine exporter family protein [Wenyingzhuangia sp. chi5]|uniref:Threonine/serine exporter family protein n=1 Tax=Wenyingzhuangia gilva TaxID=3057677 RepID=A0ABT8VPQ7_9FLAO|nr:threonine/serine exporter family protein [Wenyingzhuangia sp. chi5]MDO3693952.1 threonine/serine exporter family protein [Wenyingzhuangia sp. chi5]
MNTSSHINTSLQETADCLLEIGCLLMASGASTNRIRVTMERIADGLGYETETLTTHRTIFVIVKDSQTNEIYNSFKKTPPHGANFTLVSGISKMSWHAFENNWTLKQVKEEIDRLKKIPRYPLLITMIFVSLADAGFCRLFGGEYIDLGTAFVATFTAFTVKHYATKLNFNGYLSVIFASFTACFITSFARMYSIGNHPDLAFATAVLFLVPGIPLINSFSDIMDGHVMNGMVRGTHAMVIAFCISLGMLVTMLIFNF